MKIISQTTDQMVLKNSAFDVIMNFLFPAIFIVAGMTFVFASFQLHDNGYLQIASVLIIFGLLYVLFSVHQRIFVIDKQQGQIVNTKKRFIFPQSKVYNLSDVEKVELRKVWHVNQSSRQQGLSVSGSGRALNLSVLIIFKDARELLVDFFIEGSSSLKIDGMGISSFGKEEQKAVNLANIIALFLNVPLQESSH